ncbi:MAG: sugar ABC transporter substrate-binding protein [Candidatus Kaelpia imicola]|nr:sugar ABC transporter substrate-binding protein [Candidatus Kaelpia imicola]
MKIAKSILILISVLIWGCGKCPTSDSNKVRFAFWGSPEEVRIITSVIEEWQRDHPKIKVALEHTPYGGYSSKILTRIAGGDSPDIIAAEVGLFTNFYSKGVFLNLTPFVENDKSFVLNDFFSPIIEHFTIEGDVYGIPRDIAPFACVYYNKNIFDQHNIPYPDDDWDWDALLETAKCLTERGEKGKIKRYGFYTWAWQNFVLANGGRLVDNVKTPSSIKLNTQASREGLEFYRDLILKHRVSPTPSALINMGMGVQMMFMTGRLAMLGSGIWETPALQNIESFDWDIAVFPKSPQNIRQIATGGTAYCILKKSSNPELAWEVIKALTSARTMERIASIGLAQPSRISVAQGPYWAQSKEKPLNKKMLNEAVESVVFPPFSPNWREIEELYIKPKLDLFFNGQAELDNILPEIVEAGNKLLRE